MKDLTDPTNRDTVAAMLTPGEFVLNKEASQMYAPIIEQMNNHGLQQRHQENLNAGGGVPAYNVGGNIPNYNTGGLVDFLKEHEGYRDKAYQDQAGVWTIGYGRTRNPDGSPIKPNQTTNKKEEDSWLGKRAKTDRDATKAYGDKHGYDWNSNQIDALSSFRYNIGNLDQLTDGGTRGTEEIVQMLPEYNKAGGQVSKGLQNRRQAELDLFHNTGGSNVPVMRQAPPQAGNPLPEAYAGYSNEYQNSPQGQQSFDAAFANARETQGAGGNFNWGGQQYTTDRADDEFNMGGRIPGYNIGGWLSGLFSPDDERQAELAALANRQSDMNMLGSTNTQAADQYGMQVPPQNDLPIPNSDESLLQGSSQAVDQAKQEFVPQAMPGQQVQGGMGYNPMQAVPPGAGEIVPQFTGEFDENNQPIMEEVPYDEVPYDPRYDSPIEPYDPGADINRALDNAGQPSYAPDTANPHAGMTPYGDLTAEPTANPHVQSMANIPYNPGADINQALDNVGADSYADSAYESQDIQGGFGQNPVIPREVGVPDNALTGSPWAGYDNYTQSQFKEEADELNTNEIEATPEELAQSAFQEYGEIEKGKHTEAQLAKVEAAKTLYDVDASDDAKAKATALLKNKPVERRPDVMRAQAADAVAKVEETSTPEDIAAAKDIADKSGGAEGIITKGNEVVKADPKAVKEAQGEVKSLFGDLFDGKELMRAAVMYLGARATGMSGGQALAFAGRGYMQRIDSAASTKSKHINDLVKGGKYSTASIQAYKESGDSSDLVSKEEKASYITTGVAPQTYVVGGKAVNAIQMQNPTTKEKFWVDGVSGNRIPPTAHQNLDQVKGTPEYSKRVNDDAKQYGDSLAAIQDQYGITGKDDKTGVKKYRTGIVAKNAGRDIAKFALDNNVQPEYMDTIIRQAYDDASADSVKGNKVKNLGPYLNNAFVKAQVGDTTLFDMPNGNAVSGEKLQDVMGRIKRSVIKENPEYANIADSVLSTRVLDNMRPKWTALDAETKKNWQDRAAPQENGFLTFLRNELSQGSI